MANKKISELESRASLSLSDLMAVGDPSTGYLYKTTISDLKTLTGAGVVSFNGRFGTVNPAEGDYTLTQLGDVIITSPSNGQVLKYNGSNWVNATEAGETDTLDTVTGRGNTTANSITVGSVTAAGLSNLLGQIRTFATTGNTYIGASPVSATDAGFKLDVFGSTRVDSLTVRSQTYPTYVLTISHLGVGRQRILGGYGNEWIEFGEGGNTLSLKANEIYYQSTNNSFSANAKILSAGLGGLTFEPTNFYQQGDTRYGFQFTGNYTAAIASSPSVLGLVRFNPSIGTSIGTIDGSILHITPTINTTGGTTNWSAILYSPTISGSTGLDHFFINAASGKVKLGDLGGSGSRMVVADANGVLTTQAIPTGSVTSVFGRTGAVVAASGDYTTTQVTEGTNLYYTDARARAAITLTTTGSSGAATYSGGTLNIPTYTLAGLGGQPALNGTGFVKISGTTISYDNSSYVTLDTAQTITGAKTFSNVTTFNQNIVGGLIKLSQGVLLSKSANVGSDPGFLSIIATSSTGLNTINIADGDNTSFTQKLIVPNGGNYNYTFPTSSGTLALVSQIPSVAGVYLPLSGGTLTGALNGTTATFSGVMSLAADTWHVSSDSRQRLFFSANSITYLKGTGVIIRDNNDTNMLSFATGGAATFSSSVTTAGTISSIVANSGGDGGILFVKNSGSATLNSKAVLAFATDAGGTATNNPRIQAILKNTGNGASDLEFFVHSGAGNINRALTLYSTSEATFSSSVSVGTTAGHYSLIQRGSTPSGSQGLILTAGAAKTVNGSGITFSDDANSGGTIWLTGNSSDFYGGGVNLIAYGQNASANIITFATRSGAGTTSERMRISSGGQVGIGTSPSAILHIADASGATRLVVDNTANAGAGAGIYMRTYNGGTLVSNATIRTDNAGKFSVFTGTSSDGERFSISSTGLATFTGDVKVKTLEVTNVGTDATSSGVSTYMRITVNGQNYLIPLHGTP